MNEVELVLWAAFYGAIIGSLLTQIVTTLNKIRQRKKEARTLHEKYLKAIEGLRNIQKQESGGVEKRPQMEIDKVMAVTEAIGRRQDKMMVDAISISNKEPNQWVASEHAMDSAAYWHKPKKGSSNDET